MSSKAVVQVNLAGRLLVLVTGASRGIGKTIAVELAKRAADQSIFVLLARDKAALDDTSKEMLAVNSTLDILSFKADFAEPNLHYYNEIVDSVCKKIVGADIHTGLCFHNAGTVGTLDQAIKLEDVQVWRKYFDVNFISMSLLNSCFIKAITDKIKQVFIVNITSLCGRQPFEDLTMYGCIKATREHYFKCVALENGDKLKILNYSPGPVLTDMYNSISTSAETERVRQAFSEGKKNCLTTKQTVEKLLEILQADDYDSGAVIDYFDRI